MFEDSFSIHTSHVLSYLWIRRAVGALGLFLPVLLGPVGYWLFEIPIQENMSSYYHTVLRDVFVGTLFSIGLFMFCYVGSSSFENWTGNVGCLAAMGVALFPIEYGTDPLHQGTLTGFIHTACGGLLFSCMALFSLVHFPRSEQEENERNWNATRRWIYHITGCVLAISLIVMGIYLFVPLNYFREHCRAWNLVFWGEWVALWAFAVSWLVKGRSLAVLFTGLKAVNQVLHLRVADSSSDSTSA